MFHKLYTHAMPGGRLPAWLYARYLAWRALASLGYAARVLLVAATWLLVLPYATLRVWYMYLHMGDALADLVRGAPHAETARAPPAPRPLAAADGAVSFARAVWLELTREWTSSIVLTLCVALAFVGIFLLHEFVGQNHHEPPNDAEPLDAEHEAARERLRAEALATAHTHALEADHRAVHAVPPALPMPAHPEHIPGRHLVREVNEYEVLQHAPDQAPGTVPEAHEHIYVLRGDERIVERRVFEDTHAERTVDGDIVRVILHRKIFEYGEGEVPGDDAVDGTWDEPQGDSAWETDSDDAEPAPPPAPAPVPDDPDDDSDVDEPPEDDDAADMADHFAEDVDSALHAIGLRGPLIHVAQNLVLFESIAIVIMTVVVALPYALGRTLGFRVLDAVLLPAQALRIVTDPVFELVIERGLAALGLGGPPSDAPPVGWATAVHDALQRLPCVGAALGHAITRAGGAASAVFAALESHVRGSAWWDRVLCVALGHGYLVGALELEARLGTIVHGGTIHWARAAAQRYVTTIKVAFFLVLDVVGFPLFCGILLDWCIQPLFAGASLASLVGLARAAPLTFTVLRWTSGTVYMFFFSQFLGAIRSVVRPGVMCWMRDATDPDFHPVREILDTSAIEQLRKIGDSAWIYASVLGLVVGVSVRLLAAVPGVAPLHWRSLEPAMHVPIDLLAVHFGLRVAIKRARVAATSRRLFRRWWYWAAKRVRLSAFLMGDEQPEERSRPVYASWALWAASWVAPVAPVRRESDGGFARVPADDHPAPRARLIIPTDSVGMPLTPEGHAALDKQILSIARMREKATYSIVYLPPRFWARIFGLFALLWILCVAVVCIATGVPLAIGRGFVWTVYGAPAHDMYAVLAGYIVLGISALVARGARALLPQRRDPATYHAHLATGLHHIGRFAALLAVFGIALPLLAGLVLHQCASLRELADSPDAVPATAHTSDGVPLLNVWHTWALGAVALNTALLVMLLLRPDDYPTLWDIFDYVRVFVYVLTQMQNGRLWEVPAAFAIRTAFVPAAKWLGIALAAPYALALPFALALDARTHTVCLRWANVAVLSAVAVYLLWRFVLTRLDFWTGVLRDELFLDSTELCNYESARDPLPQNYGPLPDSVVRA